MLGMSSSCLASFAKDEAVEIKLSLSRAGLELVKIGLRLPIGYQGDQLKTIL